MNAGYAPRVRDLHRTVGTGWVGRLNCLTVSLWTHDGGFLHRQNHGIVKPGGERPDEIDAERIEAPEPDPAVDILTEIMHLVDMKAGMSTVGWNSETARLYAIDTALTMIRGDLILLSETNRLALVGRLQEAKALVVAGRDNELGFVQDALESHLASAHGQERIVWLTAMDALLPSPYQAALVGTRNALVWNPYVSHEEVKASVRERLVARLDEGALLSDPPPHLFLIA